MEVVWGIVRPKLASGKVKEIIVAAFYSPPKSRKNNLLIDHLLSTTHFLLTKYPNAGVVIGGDRNNLNISALLSGIPRLRQIVSKPTYKLKVLDVLLTNLHQAYAVPLIVPPVPTDNPLKGVPSDHSTPLACPLSGQNISQAREYITKVSRPLPDSGIREFGQWVTTEDWSCIVDNDSPTQQVLEFEKLAQSKLDIIFPLKTVKISPNFDKPFMTSDLKQLDRKVKREYRKHYRSAKYIRLKGEYDGKYLQAATAYLEKNVRTLKTDDPGKAYKNLKKLGAQPGDLQEEGSFTLQSHSDENLSLEDATERIAQHFARISQEFPPLNPELLPDSVKAKLANINVDEIPVLTEEMVWEKIAKSKKPKSTVPGDLPKRLVQEFSPELATPFCKIYQNIAKSGLWPKPWRVEIGIPLQKKPNPVDEDQLRIISLTSFFSKVFERFVVSWLLHYVGSQMDCGQFGGLKGSSISHYLIDLVNCILFNQDLNVPHAVLAVMIDFSKAFNRINHNTVITILSEMGVPGWLLKIVIGFLTEREMVLRYKGGTSKTKSLPGGGPQGTLLGLFLFLILINAAGIQHLQRHLGEHITTKLTKRSPLQDRHMKYIDDMTMAEAINLRQKLMPNPDTSQPRPFSYHERTQQVLPENDFNLQDNLNKLLEYCRANEMSVNKDKTKVMLCNTGLEYDFVPKLSIDGESFLEVMEQFKLLGVIVRSDLRWHDNTDYICTRGYERIWMIRRLKSLGAGLEDMIEVYNRQVRSVLELSVPVWQSNLTN